MKRIIIASLAALLAAPAIAQTTTTLQEVTTKGIVMHAGGFTIYVAYTPDGKFTAMDGAVTGTWRIDGEKLCTTSIVVFRGIDARCSPTMMVTESVEISA